MLPANLPYKIPQLSLMEIGQLPSVLDLQSKSLLEQRRSMSAANSCCLAFGICIHIFTRLSSAQLIWPQELPPRVMLGTRLSLAPPFATPRSKNADLDRECFWLGTSMAKMSITPSTFKWTLLKKRAQRSSVIRTPVMNKSKSEITSSWKLSKRLRLKLTGLA